MTTKKHDMATHAHNPVALITGGNRGLGRSMAVHLAEQGVGVLITYRGGAEEAAAVVKEVEAHGARGAALALDVTETRGFPAFAEALKVELSRRFDRDRFDFLVNNAGFGLHASFAETTEAQLDSLFNVHFKGPFLLTQTLLPLLADGGRILNVSTGLARFTLPGYSAYAAMKGAVEVLTRYQAKELGARGITVNTLAPGAIATDFGGGVVRDNPEVNRFVASQTALGRVGRPEDVGAAVALLLSPGGGWVNGQRIEVSGGQSL
jgi:NAD(P)-dependent dehydrogenase (short-subunit alcohol dehydrogenase family)